MPDVEPRTVPEAGVDHVDINLEETYTVEGVGTDTVMLSGTLVADRAAPLIDPKKGVVEWETSIVVANFRALNVRGKSDVFGTVHVGLDPRHPSFAAVGGGHCRAALAIVVTMPDHKLTLRSAEPVQLHSEVQTVPPVGDEKTQSIREVALVDARSHREMGRLNSARVVWRELTAQVPHDIR
jgi:hypothetical protein